MKNFFGDGDYQERKAHRKAHYEKYVHGWKSISCTACNGSGHYDNTVRGRTPECSSCDGTGKERVSPEAYNRHVEMLKSMYGEDWRDSL